MSWTSHIPAPYINFPLSLSPSEGISQPRLQLYTQSLISHINFRGSADTDLHADMLSNPTAFPSSPPGSIDFPQSPATLPALRRTVPLRRVLPLTPLFLSSLSCSLDTRRGLLSPLPTFRCFRHQFRMPLPALHDVSLSRDHS